jgi:hypothetical protein
VYLPNQLLDVDVFGYLTKIFNSSLTFTGLRNNANILQVTETIDNLLKAPVILKEVNNNAKLQASIVDFVEFVSSTVLGPVYELQFESAREKLDVIMSALKIVTRLLKHALKAKQVKIKQVLVKKVVKQNFLTLITKLQTFFNNNEVLQLQVGKFCRQLFRYPEVYLVLDLEPLIQSVFDFMFTCSHLDHFKNKNLERWFLKFFLDYSRLEEDPGKIPLKSLNMSLSKFHDITKHAVVNSSSLGWLLRIAEDRETYIRISAWNLISNLATKDNINSYQSSIESALLVLYSSNESFGVVLNAIHFLNKAIDLFMHEAAIEESQIEGGTQSPFLSAREDNEFFQSGALNTSKNLTKTELNKIIFRKNILSYLKALLSNDASPPLYLCNLAALLRNVCLLNPPRTIPILSQLEVWDSLIEVISPKKLKTRLDKKDLTTAGSTLVEMIILANNVSQFFIYSMSFDHQVGDYLIFCTKMIKVVFKWLNLLAQCYQM